MLRTIPALRSSFTGQDWRRHYAYKLQRQTVQSKSGKKVLSDYEELKE